MKRWLLSVALLLAGIACIAHAQVPMTGAGKGAPGGGGATVALDTSGWAINNNSTPTVGGAVSSASGLSGSTLLSFTYTPVGTPTAVGIVIQNYEGSGATSISSVTYGGTSAGLAGTKIAVPTTSTDLYLYCLANPTSGAQTVTVTGTIAAGSAFIDVGIFTVTHSSTSTCLRSGSYVSNTAASPATSISSTVTAQAGDFVFDNVQNWNGSAGVALTKSASQTSFGFWSLTGQDASYISATGTSTTMSWSTGSGTNFAQNAAAMQHQ